MKKHAFLIVAHQYPQLLGALIQQLDSPDSSFFIHVDAKSADFMSDRQIKDLKEYDNIYFAPRIGVYWGGFSQVEAILRLLDFAQGKGQFDYFHLLSAQDFMTRDRDEFFRFFEDTNYSYLELDESDSEFHARMDYFYLNDWIDLPRASPFVVSLNRSFNGLQARLGKLFKRQPLPFKLYKGALWWSLSCRELVQVTDFLCAHPGYLRRFRHTSCSDELFFHTILFNGVEWEKRIKPFSLRFVDWTRTAPEDRLPHILTERHADSIRNSGSLFARKIDPIRSKSLLKEFNITIN